MTGIGKLFVLANLIVSATLAAWAVSLFVNRIAWLDSTTADGQKVEGRLTAMKADLTALNSTAAGANERGRQLRQDFYAARLAQAYRGSDPQAPVPVFFDFDLVNGVGPLIDINQPGRPVLVGDNRPLRGLKDIKADLDRELAAAESNKAAIAKARAAHATVSAEITDLDAQAEAQRLLTADLTDEAKFLGSLQVNWDEELRVLLTRQSQLERRLKAVRER